MSPAAEFFGWLCSLGIFFAADPAPVAPYSVTELAERDVDYPFQGEYVSTDAGNSPLRFGLQVVALGEAKFSAMLHENGLPGAGGSGISAYRLHGERSTSSNLRLEGGGWRADITDGKTVQIESVAGSLPVAMLTRTLRVSPTMGAKPPVNAVILFDGSQPTKLANAELTDDGLLNVGAETTETYRDFFLHAEFRTPYLPANRGQKRGNSGFYLQRRYEVQVLDSFGQWPQYNEAASLYKSRPPSINMSFPPLTWQTYDIDFTAPRFDALGNKVSHARLTIRHNGMIVHNNFELHHKTGGGKPEGPLPLPILIQNHGDPVHFRNIWLVER